MKAIILGKTKISGTALALASLLALSPVQAANYQLLAGQDIDFYVDASVLDVTQAGVSGDVISFNTPGFIANSHFSELVFSDGIVAVAHNGYQISSTAVIKMSGWTDQTYGDYGNPTGSGFLSVWGGYHTGNFNGQSLTNAAYVAQFSADMFMGVSGDAYASVQVAGGAAPYYRVLGVDADYVTFAGGFATAGMYGYSYEFTVSPAPVPEPDTYLMSLAGLTLLGGLARRKQAQRPDTTAMA